MAGFLAGTDARFRLAVVWPRQPQHITLALKSWSSQAPQELGLLLYHSQVSPVLSAAVELPSVQTPPPHAVQAVAAVNVSVS